jgi:hypothetical protein
LGKGNLLITLTFVPFCVSPDDEENVWQVIKITQNISPNPEYFFSEVLLLVI